VIRKDAFLFARRTRRWWSAPARFSAATLARLQRAAARQSLPANAWLHHAPAGINSPLAAE
jgi:hypothetical protein